MRWQFSLRTLLLMMLVCAAAACLWKIMGDDGWIGALFVVLSGTPIVIVGGMLRRAYGLSLCAVYGPFTVMAAYTNVFVACSHCKETTLELLPYAPGMVLLELVHHLLDLPRPDGVYLFALAILCSVVVVLGLTWVVRTRGPWVKALSLTATLLVFSFCAFVLLAAIQA